MGDVFSSPVVCSEDEVEILEDPDTKRDFWTGFKVEDFETLKTLKPKLKPGDMVSVKRGIIEHVILYIGNDHCVHFYEAGNSGKRRDVQCILEFITQNFSIIPNNVGDHPGVVALENIGDIIGNDKCRVNNRIEHVLAFGIRKRRKGYKIIEEAQKAWENGQKSPPNYNISRYNCETFALELRYGQIITSEQVCPAYNYHKEL